MFEEPLRVADRIKIAELCARYTHHYDNRELEAFVDLFTEEGVMQLGPEGFARGREDLRTAIAATMDFVDFACHFVSDLIIEFMGEATARGTSRFSVHCGHEPTIQGAGTYHDDYVLTDHGWRFASRTMSFFYMGHAGVPWPTVPPPLAPTVAAAGE